MPNRIIREGWIESEGIDTLTPEAERFFLRLLLRADDFGRFHANPQLLKSSLFPLKDSIRNTDIALWLDACEKCGLLRCYELTGRRYLVIDKFGQRTRASSSKFPAPDGQASDPCLTDVSPMTVTCQARDGPPRTYSETYSETETKSNSEANARATPAGSKSTAPAANGTHRRLPSTAEEAVAMAKTTGVAEEMIRKEWFRCLAAGWDKAGPRSGPVANWPAQVQWAAAIDRSRQAEQASRHGPSNTSAKTTGAERAFAGEVKTGIALKARKLGQ
jgi:hypothetical protein